VFRRKQLEGWIRTDDIHSLAADFHIKQSRDGGGEIACYAFVSASVISCGEGPERTADVVMVTNHGALRGIASGTLKYHKQHRNVSSFC
jgi:phosphodiesterase/alkaline phosphatase D-like protein